MPWYRRSIDEYICNDCGGHFFSRIPPPTTPVIAGGYPISPVTLYGPGGGRTRCQRCANLRMVRAPRQPPGTTITYRIHGHPTITRHVVGVPAQGMNGGTMNAMTASGAFGQGVPHPGYPGAPIRLPQAFTGINFGSGALRGWPVNAGMAQHHVHVGAGVQNRVLFGWAYRTYPPPNQQWVRVITLYIGS